jgi:methionyl-tRNA formyltransferase
MKIIFLGSTDFSLPILPRIREKFDLAGLVIVKPKPQGRGLKIVLPGLAAWAQSSGIRIFAPDKPDEPAFIDELKALKPDIFVLAAYGHILSGEFLRIPRFGGINIHPSLLPKYRGAAPIQRAILNDEKSTGLTIFFMDEKIDHGDVVFNKVLPIEESDNYGTLSDKLSALAASEICGILSMIDRGDYPRIPQDDKDKCAAPKIHKDEMVIDWLRPARQIFNLIRALAPNPGARTIFRNKELIVTKAVMNGSPLPDGNQPAAGFLMVFNKNLYAGTGDCPLILQELKPENKKRISGLDFINGFRIKEGEKIE